MKRGPLQRSLPRPSASRPRALLQRWALSALLACLLALAGEARAEEPQRPAAPPEAEGETVDELLQELFLGQSVYPQEAGELQLTSELSALREETTDRIRIVTLAELGITDNLQIGASIPAEVSRARGQSSEGTAGFELEVMWNPWNDRQAGLAFSTGMGVAPPALIAGADEPAWAIEPFAVAYLERLPFAVNLSVALEWGIPTEEAAKHELGGEAALGVLFDGGAVTPVLEVSAGIEEEQATLQFASGFVLHVTPHLDLGAAGLFQLLGPAPHGGGVLSVTWEETTSKDAD